MRLFKYPLNLFIVLLGIYFVTHFYPIQATFKPINNATYEQTSKTLSAATAGPLEELYFSVFNYSTSQYEIAKVEFYENTEKKTARSLIPLTEIRGKLDLSNFTSGNSAWESMIYFTFQQGIDDDVISLKQWIGENYTEEYSCFQNGDEISIKNQVYDEQFQDSPYELVFITNNGDQTDGSAIKYIIDVTPPQTIPVGDIFAIIANNLEIYEMTESGERKLLTDNIRYSSLGGSQADFFLGLTDESYSEYLEENKNVDIAIDVDKVNASLEESGWVIDEIEIGNFESLDSSASIIVSASNPKFHTTQHVGSVLLRFVKSNWWTWGTANLRNSAYEEFYIAQLAGNFNDDVLEFHFPSYTDLKDSYVLSMIFYGTDEQTGMSENDNYKIKEAYIGHYDTLQEAKNSSNENIAEILFTERDGVGYETDYSGEGIKFTAFEPLGTVPETYEAYKFIVKMYDSSSEEMIYTNLNVNHFSNISPFYKLTVEQDSLYKTYQTFFTANNLSLEKLIPTFSVTNGAEVFVNGVKQTSGSSSQNFTNPNVIYTVNGKNYNQNATQNYFVTVAQKDLSSTEGKLFINGPNSETTENLEKDASNTRNIYFENVGDCHDIFIANIGNGNLEDIKVELLTETAGDSLVPLLLLDDYWTLDGNNSLSPFDEGITDLTSSSAIHGAKIRIKANDQAITDETGNISIESRLVITSGNQSFTVFLSGIAGTPKIIVETLQKGVQYVPYSAMVQTNNNSENLETNYSLSGYLPSGFDFDEYTGEIYGITGETGDFDLTITASYAFTEAFVQINPELKGTYFSDSVQEFTLTILDNTDEYVEMNNYHTSDDGQSVNSLVERVPDLEGIVSDQIFVSLREYDEFVDFYLNGNILEENIDYNHEEGSTKITILSNTFSSLNSGIHTISAEFRTQDNVLTTTSQNFKTTNVTPDNSNSGNGSAGEGTGSNANNGYTSTGTGVVTSSATIPALHVSNGGTASVTPEKIESDKTATITVVPKEGYQLESITVTDLGGNSIHVTSHEDGTYRFVQPVEKVTINVVFMAQPLEPVPEPEAPPTLEEGQIFYDVKPSDWYYEYVNFISSCGIMSGVGDDYFLPDEETLRGMIVTVLYSMAEKPDLKQPTLYTDINYTDYYFVPSLWASEQGIVYGIGNDEFSPNTAVSREEICLILYRFAEYQDNVMIGSIPTSYWSDVYNINSWAIEAVLWCYSNGIISGRENNTFEPQESTTRAEIATILSKYISLTT